MLAKEQIRELNRKASESRHEILDNYYSKSVAKAENAKIKTGDFKTFNSVEEFIADLHAEASGIQ